MTSQELFSDRPLEVAANADERRSSVTGGLPRVDERPEPDGQQETQGDKEIGPERRGRQQIARQRSTGEPAEHDAGHDERGALDRLAIVELSETGEDPGENECNDLSRSGGLVHGITVGR